VQVGLEALRPEKYVSLTTFRRDGTPAATPVWFVTDDSRLLIWTASTTWKVKRLRANPRVRVAACNFKGDVHGETYDGEGTLLPPDAGALVQRLLREKYGFEKRGLDLYNAAVRIALRRRRTPAAYIEVRLLGNPPSA